MKNGSLAASIGVLLIISGCSKSARQSNGPSVVHAGAVTAASTPSTPATPVTAEKPEPLVTSTPQNDVDANLVSSGGADSETEKALHDFLSLPDPKPPVSLDKMQGMWWTENDGSNKIYAFVEKLDLSAEPYGASLSLANGTTLEVKCNLSHPPLRHSGADVSFEHCEPLPPFTWIRMAAGNVIRDPNADVVSQWNLEYRAIDDDSVSIYLVDEICHPDGSCTTIEQAGRSQSEIERNRRRRGED